MSKRVNNKRGRSPRRANYYGHPTKVRTSGKGVRYDFCRKLTARGRHAQQVRDTITRSLNIPPPRDMGR